jgi:uncharacterized DUF497 family protein
VAYSELVGGFQLEFEWDEKKDRTNFEKHGVSFTLALSVLRDPLAVTSFDETHSETEERWFTIGRTPAGECLTVAHTWTDIGVNTAKVRIISARKATNAERRWYEEGL